MVPKTAFYDWLYLTALSSHQDFLKRLFRYKGFTDIEFNPQKSINCQARTVALLVSLLKLNSLDVALLLELRNQTNQKPKKQKSGGVKIPREVLMRLDLGRPMFNVVIQAYSSGVLDVFDASRILNLRVKKIDTLLASTGR